jgi:hypothetical protein
VSDPNRRTEHHVCAYPGFLRRRDGTVVPARACLDVRMPADGLTGLPQDVSVALTALQGLTLTPAAAGGSKPGSGSTVLSVAPALYPKLPKADAVRDPRDGTYDTDENYKAFVAAFEAAAKAL